MTDLPLIEHVIEQPWHITVEAFWRGFPTHELFPELIKSQLFEKSFDERNGKAKIKRECTFSNELPMLVKRFLGNDETGFRMMQVIDINWRERKMQIESSSVLERISVHEILTYEVHIGNDEWTHICLQGQVKCDLMFGLQQYVERFCREMYTTNMMRRNERDLHLVKKVQSDYMNSSVTDVPPSLVKIFSPEGPPTSAAPPGILKQTPSDKVSSGVVPGENLEGTANSGGWRAPLNALQGFGTTMGTAIATAAQGAGVDKLVPNFRGEEGAAGVAAVSGTAAVGKETDVKKGPKVAMSRNSVRTARGSISSTRKTMTPGSMKPTLSPLHVFGRTSNEVSGAAQDESALYTHYQTLPEHRIAEAEAAMSKMVMF